MKTALVVGADRGLGLSICKDLKSQGHRVIGTSRKSGSESLKQLHVQIIPDIDLLDESSPKRLSQQLKDTKLDWVFHVAGYFTTEGALVDLNRSEQRKMLEVCAIAPVFIFSELLRQKHITSGSKILFITSEGGSIGLRTLKEGGANYGHHMSKAAANMAGRLAAFDLHPHGIRLIMVHPGFLRTDMTVDKYADSYEELGAVTPGHAAPFIRNCIERLDLENTGQFVAALGSDSFGYGVYALPIEKKYQREFSPGGQIPW